MNIFAFSDEIIKRLHERKSILSERILNGSVQSYEDYRFLVGKVTALDESIILVASFIKSLEKGSAEVYDPVLQDK